MRYASLALAASIATLAMAVPAQAQDASSMTFFVTSAGSVKGADLGGLDGADTICQTLATKVGAGQRAWHAYLSTQEADGKPAVNARDRIGKGPWQNAKGVVIAKDVADLHSDANNLNKDTALTETGATVNGRGDTPNTHDILTGSQPDGTAFPPGEDKTCGNWTKGGVDGAAMLGHHDRIGINDSAPMKSWNSSHLTRGGCNPAALQSTGGAGLLYCFATD